MRHGLVADPPGSLEGSLRDFLDATLVQHRIKFWAAIATSAVGLALLLTALVAYLRDPASLSEALRLGAVGVLSHLAAALIFYLHHKGLAQTLAGLEALGNMQETRLAIDLVDRLNEKDRDKLLMSLSDALMLRNESSREASAQLVWTLREKSNS